MNLRSVWYLFYLLFFGFYTYKAVRPSAVESIAVEVLPDEHTLGHAGAVPVIRSSRAEQVSNSYNYSVHNFSTTTVIVPPFISSHESLCNTVASLQWIGNPPSQVSTHCTPLLVLLFLPFTAFDSSLHYGQRKSRD